MSEKKAIKFIINGGDPTDIAYLNAPTCEELLKVAKQQLTAQQLRNNTFVLEDDQQVIYGEDDDDLVEVYETFESDDEQILCLNMTLIPNTGCFYLSLYNVMTHM